MKGGLGQYVYLLCSIGIHKWQLEAREVPAYALGWYVIDENGDPKCERF